MTASRWLSLALGLALAAPVAAYAYETPFFHHHAHQRTLKHHVVAMAPAAASSPQAGLWAPSYTPSHERYEIEGLTRNPEDCVKYGCIGND